MQAVYFFALFLSLVATSRAISVTSPGEGTTWSSSGSHTITWTRVSTDPDSCAITLVQQGVYRQTLVDSVDTNQGSITITNTLPVGNTYQVNLVKSSSPQDLNTILAQSAQFNITQGSAASSSEAASGSTAGATTATSTASLRTSGTGSTPLSTILPASTEVPNTSNSALTPSQSSSGTRSFKCQSGLLSALALSGFALFE